MLFGKFALLVGGGCPCRESGYGGGAQSEDGTCGAYHSDFSRKTEGKGAAVVYLLHGYGGNETTWPSLKPELKDYADRENLIFVCPNGENSWYWDSPLNEDSQFETFVSRELVSYVDGHYRTLPSREKRAITGLSMGGHGAYGWPYAIRMFSERRAVRAADWTSGLFRTTGT